MTTDTELRDLLAAEAGSPPGRSGGWEDVLHRGRRRRRMRRVQTLALVAAVVAGVSLTAITLSSDDPDVETTPPAGQPAPRDPEAILPSTFPGGAAALDRGNFDHRWSVIELGSPVWQDALDTDLGFVDVERVRYNRAAGWYIELAAKPPPLADREPGLVIAYGLVFDTTGDGVADYVVGIDDAPPEQGRYHVWLTDLAPGGTTEQFWSSGLSAREQLGAPYDGYPIEFRHPDLSSESNPSMSFGFLAGSAPEDLNPENLRFYAWTSATQDGELVASDYAPDTGWTS